MNERVRITIDLGLTQPVSGAVSSEGGPPVAFDGWLELHSALEELCGAAAAKHLQWPDRPIEPEP